MQIAQGRALLGLERAAEAKPQFEAALAARARQPRRAARPCQRHLRASKACRRPRPSWTRPRPTIQKKPQYWMAMGGINTQGGDFAAAEQAYQKARRQRRQGCEGGERLMALGALAESQMRQGKVKEATATAEQLSKAAPEQPAGQAAARARWPRPAATSTRRARCSRKPSRRCPTTTQARLMLGIVNLQQGNLGQAEMHFQTVLANEPEQRPRAEAAGRDALAAAVAGGGAGGAQAVARRRQRRPVAARHGGPHEPRQRQPRPGAGVLHPGRGVERRRQDARPTCSSRLASGYLMAGDLDRALELLEKMPAGGATDFQRDYLTDGHAAAQGRHRQGGRRGEAPGGDARARTRRCATSRRRRSRRRGRRTRRASSSPRR